jgi:nucleotide-binding universal stress UspA family protein
MAFPYRKILCPINFDDNSLTAIHEAAAIAAHHAGTLTLLHVVHINPLVAQGAAEGYAGAELYEGQLQAARDQVGQLLGNLPQGMKPEIVVDIGDPAEVILATGVKLQADLVVMATHGRTGLARIVMGSVTDKIVRGSHVPVLTLLPPAHDTHSH